MNRALLWTALVFAVVAPIRAADKIPKGFVEQPLKPTGGTMLRPKNWFFRPAHREEAFMWTASKEDTKDGTAPYETGVRIQFFIGVKERTSQTAEAQARSFLAEKKKAATKVHRVFEQEEQGFFSRLGLESEEGKYHLVYSIFWNNKADAFAVMIAGTTIEKWDQHAETFDTMSAIRLIDLKKLEEEGGKEETKPQKTKNR